MAYVHSLEIWEAPYLHSQEDILTFMQGAFAVDRRQKLMLESAFSGSAIAQRRSILPDFSTKYGRQELFVDDSVPGIEKRMELFFSKGLQGITEAAQSSLKSSELEVNDITHLIVFSCTGLMNPGFENTIISACGLPANVVTQGLYFAGCHGAFKALKIAQALVNAHSTKKANVLVCGLELCTLHFLPSQTSDQVRANTIFADGFAAFIVSSEPKGSTCYKLGRGAQEIIPTPTPLMSWHIGKDAFYMTLSSKIDTLLAKFPLKPFIASFFEGAPAVVACHPGGKSILDVIEAQTQEAFGLSLKLSYDVLRKGGNMSSISILHVLATAFRQKPPSIVALGFGPGVTVEGLALTHAQL
jgi:predicted naringenin-chalcone synthase